MIVEHNDSATMFSKVFLQPVRTRLRRHVRQPACVSATVPRLAALRDAYAGRRCFVVGTAPSLQHLDLARIRDDYVFLVNSGYRLADRFGRPPDALMITNPFAYAEQIAKIAEIDFNHFFVSAGAFKNNKKKLNEAIIFHQWEEPRIYDGFFQSDCTRPLYHAHTVVLSAVQLAAWMGFREIVVIGVDLDFQSQEPHVYASSVAEKQRAREFLRWRTHTKLYNAGVGGRLDCIPRVDYETLFG